jgi:REP-associated tyrosine transposase
MDDSHHPKATYVHHNPARHGLVREARQYRWCSAGWFERVATRAQVATMARIKTDKVNVPDEYEPVMAG